MNFKRRACVCHMQKFEKGKIEILKAIKEVKSYTDSKSIKERLEKVQ